MNILAQPKCGKLRNCTDCQKKRVGEFLCQVTTIFEFSAEGVTKVALKIEFIFSMLFGSNFSSLSFLKVP